MAGLSTRSARLLADEAVGCIAALVSKSKRRFYYSPILLKLSTRAATHGHLRSWCSRDGVFLGQRTLFPQPALLAHWRSSGGKLGYPEG